MFQVHSIEADPGEGGIWCRAAGSFALLKGHQDDRCIVQLPSGLELSLSRKCMATVGQVSHASHQDEKLKHPVDKRDLGYRPRSGLWQRKDGYSGRKSHPPKTIKVIGKQNQHQLDEDHEQIKTRIKYTYKNWSLTE